jgi:hypothetical protein
MKNVVERVVAELLTEVPEQSGVLSDGQYECRIRQSKIKVATIIVDRAHTAWGEGHIGGVLLMDIKVAFPCIGRGRLIHTMRDKGMDGAFI